MDQVYWRLLHSIGYCLDVLFSPPVLRKLSSSSKIISFFLIFLWWGACLAQEEPAARKLDPFARPAPSSQELFVLGAMPIEHGGRLKPWKSFAKEMMQAIHGSFSFKGLSSLEVVLSMLFESPFWDKESIILVDHRPLKKDIGLEERRKHFSFQELWSPSLSGKPSVQNKLDLLFKELKTKIDRKEKLDSYFSALQSLRDRIALFSQIRDGSIWRVVPPSKQSLQEGESPPWRSLRQIPSSLSLPFLLLGSSYTSLDSKVRKTLKKNITLFQSLAKKENPPLFPSARKMYWEVRLHKDAPFYWAWIIALFACLLFVPALVQIMGPSAFSIFCLRAGYSLYAVSILLQLYGFIVRSYIAGRPPVTNMYESVIWVAFCSMLLGLWFALRQKKVLHAFGAGIFSVLMLFIADRSPMVLNASIAPLEAVLRSNFWLSTHVLIITVSYAAFGIGCILSNLSLFPIALRGKESIRFPLTQTAQMVYRTTQIGVLLLALGTILGGIWADYSWGRFWGWDPKETWAFIALLGYLLVLHLRLSGLVQAFGFLFASALAFAGVVMAWYGVNFILGAGLHSYGFSTGGVNFFAGYVFLQLLCLGLAAARKT